MTNRQLIKTIVRALVVYSTSFTVRNVLAQNVQTETNLQKAGVVVGSTATGLLVGDAVGDYTDNAVDKLFGAFDTTSANK